jgi:DNA-binding MarR family transcriptional regulator
MKRSVDGKPTAADSTELGSVLDFMRLLWALDHGLQMSSRRMESQLGVTGPQRMAIRMVGRFPGISAGELASLLHVHPSTLTGVLKRLEQRGLVNRSADPRDGRRARFSLTPTGQEIDTVKSGTVEAAVKLGLENVTSQKMKTTQEVLRVLIDALTPDLDAEANRQDEHPGEA